MRRGPRRVLVTGGAGFIPSNFIRHLLRTTSWEVVSLDALTYAGSLENLAEVMSHERLSFVQGDIRDTRLVRDIVGEVDVIVNAAADVDVDDASALLALNPRSPRGLLLAARAADDPADAEERLRAAL